MKIDEALSRIEAKLDAHIEKVEPMLVEYHASKLLKARVGDWIKTVGMVVGIALSSITLKDKLSSASQEVKISSLK